MVGLRWARFLACALVVAGSIWAAEGVFLPMAHSETATAYILVSASSNRFVLDLAVTVAALLGWQAFVLRRWRRPFSLRRWLRLDESRHVMPLFLLGLSLVPAVNLATPLGHVWASWSYVLVDLRWWWWGLIFVWVAHAARPGGLSPRWRAAGNPPRPWAELSIVAASLGVAFVATPNTRFGSSLAGDEPKYMRHCESLYQGLGFDIAALKRLDQLPADYEPRALENLRGLGAIIAEESRNLAADGRALLTGRREFNRARYMGGWFLEGKKPGSLYQIHTPGLGMILFPAYYLDRRLLSDEWTWDGKFPLRQDMLGVGLLTLFGLYTLVVYHLLCAHTDRRLAWILTFLAMVTMPVGAFAFQAYPEIAAGVLLTSSVLYLRSSRRSAWMALACGAGAGFLPWLHVRFGLAALVFLGWSLLQWRQHRRATASFEAGLVLVFGSFCLYVYHVTGSLLPSGLYDVRGAYFSVAQALAGWRILLFDSTWSPLAYSPIYAISLLGMGLTWRAKPGLAALVTLVLLTLVLSAGHDAMAGGTTPSRYLVAGLPLLMVFVADAALHWQRSRVFTAALVVLSLVSIDAGVTYNLHFEKGVSQLVADGFAGFRPNLLFPAVTREGWTTLPWAAAIVGVWAAVFAGLLVAGVWASWQAARHASSLDAHPLTWSIRPNARFIAGGFAILAAAGTVVSAASGEFVRSDFMPTPAEVRDRALESFREQGRCTACAATGFGEASPVEVLGFSTTAVSLDLAPAPGPDLSYRLRAVAARGETERGWGSLTVDFGDGTVERDSRVFGEGNLDHTYRSPGLYVVKTSFESGGDVRFDDERLLDVRRRPESRSAPPSIGNISQLPTQARDSRRTATITDVLVGGGRVDVRHDAGGRWSGEDVWLVTHTAAGWLATPVDGPVNPPASGAMVGVLVVARGMASAERTGLAMFHWPPVEVSSRRGPVRVALAFRGSS